MCRRNCLDAHIQSVKDVDKRSKDFKKPYCHFHTQFNREIPWNEIDMDFMNLNQSAHGDREHGFIGSRLRMARKVIVGYWEDEEPQTKLANWMRSAWLCNQPRA